MTKETKQKVNELKAEAYDNANTEADIAKDAEKKIQALRLRRQAIVDELKQLEKE